MSSAHTHIALSVNIVIAVDSIIYPLQIFIPLIPPTFYYDMLNTYMEILTQRPSFHF